jgi:hypothetical protein
MEGLADQPIGHQRPVGLTGVDVGDAQLDDVAEYGECAVVVGRRAHDAGAGELHGAVAHAVHGAVAQ